MLTNTVEVTRDTLLQEVANKRHQGFRFVTVTCTDLGDKFDIIYHFDKDYVLHNVRLALAKDAALPSASGIFFAAVVVENELKDLFGINVTDLAIDYGGRFMLSEGAPVAPQRKPVPAPAAVPGAGAPPAQKGQGK